MKSRRTTIVLIYIICRKNVKRRSWQKQQRDRVYDRSDCKPPATHASELFHLFVERGMKQ